MATLKEIQDKVRKNRYTSEENTAPSTSLTKSKTLEDIKKKAAASAAADVDDQYIRSYLSDSQKFFSQAQSDYSGLNWTTGSDKSKLDSRKATAADLLSREKKIRAFYSLNKDGMDESAYNNMMEYLDSTSSMYGNIGARFDDAYNFYSQWESEDLYMRDNAFYEKYGKLQQNEDYETASGNRDLGSTNALDYIRYSVNYGGGSYYDPDTKELVQLAPTWRGHENYKPGQITDKLGFYLQHKDLPTANLYERGTDYDNTLAEGAGSGWEQMTDQQIADYYYLYNTQGQAAAYEYLDDIAFVLRRDRYMQERADTIAAYENASGAEKAWMSVKSIPAQFLASTTSGIDALYRKANGMDWEAYTGVQYGNNVRQLTAAELDEKIGDIVPAVGFSAGDAYQALMSGADSVFTGLVTGGAGIAKLGGPTARAIGGLITSSAMAGGAYASEAQRLYEMGATQEQIQQGATAAALTEVLSEMLPLDNMFKIKDGSAFIKMLKNAAVQAGVEGLEEVVSGAGNYIANYFIMQDESDLAKMWEEQGSLLGVGKELLKQGISDFLGGAFSAGVTGNVGAIGPAISYINNQHNVGSGIRQSNMTGTLTDLAMQKIENADPRTAKRLQKQVDRINKGATNSNVGKLYNALGTADQTQVQKATSQQLQETGMSKKEANKLAEAMVRQAYGEMLTDDQSEIFDKYANNEGAQKIYDSVREQRTTVDQQMVDQRVSQTMQAVQRQLEEQGVAPETAAELAQMAVDGTMKQEQAAATKNQDTWEQPQSAKGQVVYEDQQVQVAGVKSAGNGQLIVQLADGASVDASQLSFPSQGEQLLYQVVGKIADSTETANKLLQGVQNGKASASVYAKAIEQAFFYGRHNIPLQQLINESPYAQALTAEQLNQAYNMGKEAGPKNTNREQNRVDDTYNKAKQVLGDQQEKTPRTYTARAAEGVNVKKFSPQQKAAYQLMQNIAPAVKGNMVAYEGGKEWGYYNHTTDEIYINVNATWSKANMMAFTMGHELAHRAKAGSPKQFKAFADFLVEQYGKQGASVNDMIIEQITAAEREGRQMTTEEALEEVVADACQRMLLDTDAGQRLAEWGAQSSENQSFLAKVKKIITDLLDRLRRYFKNVDPDSKAAQEFAKIDANAKQILADMFVDMSIDAGEKLSTIREAGLDIKNTAQQDGVKYKLNANAANELHKALYDMKYRSEILLRDETPGIMLGHKDVRNLPMFMKISHIRENVFTETEAQSLGLPTTDDINYHGLGEVLFLRIIDSLDDVKEAYRGTKYADDPSRREKYFLLVTEIADAEGNTVNVPIYINEKSQYNRVFIDTNKIATAYGKTELREYINREIRKKNIVRIKNKSSQSSERSAPVAEGYRKAASKNSIREEKDVVKENVPHKTAVAEDLSPRELLLNTVEGMVANSVEYRELQKYRRQIQELNATEEKVERLGQELRKLYFAEGGRDYDMINKLEAQRREAVDKLNKQDAKLISLENTKPIRDIVDRMKKAAYDKGFRKAKDYYKQKADAREEKLKQHYQESRRNAVERHDKAQIRQQIRKDVERLASLLNKGNKQKHVKQELQAFAGAALRTAKGTFLNNYNEYDMVRNGITGTVSREHRQILQRCQELLTELDQVREEMNQEPGADNLHDKWDPEAALRRNDREEALKKELAKNMAILRDAGVFKVENELMEDSNAEQLMSELLAAYKELQDSESAHVRGVYSQVIYDQIDGVRKFLAGKAVKDMTTVELKELQKMYRLVLYTISTSNELFAQKRNADVRKLGEEVIQQLQDPGKAMTPEILDRLKKMGWANLKPETALELIGSDTLTEMMQGLYRGEDTYALDIDHARQFAQEQAQKYGRKGWDMEKAIPFAGTKITLGQALSLYAYTKRQQAQGHLEGDGFTSASNVRIKAAIGKLPVKLKYIMNATKTHTVSKDMYARVADLLTPQQKKYAEAMMEYLTKVMGTKGNEVSMKLYGIELFQEKAYFPIKTAAEYHDEALGATAGEVKLKNNGFTKSVQEGASNPIVLDDFERIWAGHVDKMSLYHGFVLPMEDFDRVYNYHLTAEREVTDAAGEVYKTETVDTNETVKVDIENKCGKAANAYIEQFMQQLNGGVRGDSTEKLFAGMVRNFKKTAVLGSLSVAIQQPTAFVRAMAYLDMRDIADWRNWLGKSGKPEGKIVEEMYKYAPVALMKKIGGFDPGLGRSSQDYIFNNKKGVGRWLENVTGWLPERMDEWTWTYIWVCSKRQIHRQNPDLRVGSKEFCEKAGELFSKIIRDTQVYDSVLVKTQVMRSKNLFLQMATSFMNEPTTSLDMFIRSHIQAKRGKIKKKQIVRVYGAVAGSQILCAALSAFVYAARDDDEDETFWEKYVSAAISKTLESGLLLSSIPFVKDIVSIFEGYDVERSDMAIVADIYQGWQKLRSSNEDITPWERYEAFCGSILNLFGIPLKNVSREIRGIYNTIDHWRRPRTTGTKLGMRIAMKEGAPFAKEYSGTKHLEQAMVENDAAHILRRMATYDTEDAAQSAVRTAVKDAYMGGKITEERAVEYLQTYGGLDEADALEKIVYFEFAKAYPESELHESAAIKWYTVLQYKGIELEEYEEFLELTAGLEADKDKNGKAIQGSKKKKIMDVIHSMDLTPKQKDALYLSAGLAESTIDEAPWR